MKKKFDIRKLSLLVFVIFAISGTLGFFPSVIAPKGYIVSAGCTKAGKASYDQNGVPVCDCSGPLNEGNCSCIIPCPKDEENY